MIDLNTNAAVSSPAPPPVPIKDAESYQTMLQQAESVQKELEEAVAPSSDAVVPMQEAPHNVQEAYQTSWKSLLSRNLGRKVIVSFLMGTQNTVVAEGVLYEIGSDYLVLYQPSRDSYITADLYSVKFVEFRADDNRIRT